MSRVHISRTLTEKAMESLKGYENIEFSVGGALPPDRDDLLAAVQGVDGAIVTLSENIDEDFFQAAGPQLKVVANLAVGYDNIDLDAAKRHGVVITNTPGVLDGATADLVFALILDVARRVTESDRFIRSGESWNWGANFFGGLDISAGKTLAIIGFGRIGQAVARRAHGFDMKVVGVARSQPVGSYVEDTEIVSLDTALAQADIVTLHVPLTESTRGLVDDQFLAKMKPGSYLVNAARGGVADEEALMRALDSGHLQGLALDVYQGEPNIDPRWLKYEQVVLTPHIGTAGIDTRETMSRMTLDNVLDVLSGGSGINVVV